MFNTGIQCLEQSQTEKTDGNIFWGVDSHHIWHRKPEGQFSLSNRPPSVLYYYSLPLSFHLAVWLPHCLTHVGLLCSPLNIKPLLSLLFNVTFTQTLVFSCSLFGHPICSSHPQHLLYLILLHLLASSPIISPSFSFLSLSILIHHSYLISLVPYFILFYLSLTCPSILISAQSLLLQFFFPLRSPSSPSFCPFFSHLLNLTPALVLSS